MKKLIFMAFLLITTNASAMLTWTGNEVIFVNDFPTLGSNWGYDLGLGGPIGNQAVAYKAFEFTTNRNDYTDFLFVYANVIPTEESKSIGVNFQLYKGTKYYGYDGEYAAPDSLLLKSNAYTFGTGYTNLKVPFRSKLSTKDTYWLMADARNEWSLGPTGATFDYSTDLHTVHNPEPATLLLMGGGLMGSGFLRTLRRKKWQSS